MPVNDCACLCHKGGKVIHVVPCCDEMLPEVLKKRKPKKSHPTAK